MRHPLTHRYDLFISHEGDPLSEMHGVLWDTCYLAFPAMVFDSLPYMDVDFLAEVYDPFETVKDVMKALNREEIYNLWWEMDNNQGMDINFHGVDFRLVR